MKPSQRNPRPEIQFYNVQPVNIETVGLVFILTGPTLSLYNMDYNPSKYLTRKVQYVSSENIGTLLSIHTHLIFLEWLDCMDLCLNNVK